MRGQQTLRISQEATLPILIGILTEKLVNNLELIDNVPPAEAVDKRLVETCRLGVLCVSIGADNSKKRFFPVLVH